MGMKDHSPTLIPISLASSRFLSSHTQRGVMVGDSGGGIGLYVSKLEQVM